MRVWLTSAAVLAVLAGAASAGPPPGRARMDAVVREWVDRLNADDNAGLAKLYDLPTLVTQGPYTWRLRTRAQLALWYSGLPCAGRIVSISFSGRYATAVFRLRDRGKIRCDAPGTLAAARFGFAGGKIATWAQVPVPAKKGGAISS
jgi:hypothetical protein